VKNTLFSGMPEVLEFTRAGRLQEATAAIQAMLRGQPARKDEAKPSFQEEAIDGVFHVIDDVSEAAQQATQPRVRDGSEGVRPGQFVSASFTNHAGTRAYKLYIPRQYRGEKLPLIVMLHGCKQHPDDFAAGTRMNRIVDEHPCFVLYPAQARGANPSKCWNWFRESDQKRDSGEPALIAGMTQHIIDSYPVDSRRVYVAGLSAGGAMAVTMGRTYPDIYAAIGVHSGLPYGAARNVPSAFAAMRKNRAPKKDSGLDAAQKLGRGNLPTIVFHGDADTTVHPFNGEQVSAQCRGVGFGNEMSNRTTVHRGQVPNGHAYTRTVFRDENDHCIVEHWVVHGGGHAWSGGSLSGSFTDPRGPDASREMLRFFSEHPRRTPH
jgi:poly(hydroxyalkanoate) depolymerase family esterase